PQDCEDTRRDNPTVHPDQGRRDHPVARARPTRPAPAIRRRLLDSRQPSPTEVPMRRIGLVVLSISLMLAPLVAWAQRPAKIGYLALNLDVNRRSHEAFRQGLRDLGYVEGRNLVIEYRDAAGKPERLAAGAAELVALNVDVIVAPGTRAALAAKRTTASIP